MEFGKVVNGIVRYIDKEIYPGMAEWQELMARVAVSRILSSEESLKASLSSNAFLRTFAIIDSDGSIDVDGLARDLKAEISKKGKIEIALPMFGRFRFSEADVDKLYEEITKGGAR